MTYTLYFTEEAKKDLAGLKKNEPAAFKKATALLKELQAHPRTGTGKPIWCQTPGRGTWHQFLLLKPLRRHFHTVQKCFKELLVSYFGISKNTLELDSFILGITVNFRVGIKQKMPEIH